MARSHQPASPPVLSPPTAAERPRLYSWGARALFLGPALNLTAHRNAVAVVAVGLDRPFAVACDPGRPQAGAVACRAALIAPNALHRLACGLGRMAFLYVDATSRDLETLEAAVASPGRQAGFDLRCEAALLEILGGLAERPEAFAEARQRLQAEVLGAPDQRIDPRVKAAIDHLNAHAADRPSLAQLATLAGLSSSRFRHIFRAVTGVPLRRYRVWVAFGAAMRAVGRGASLTQAAYDGGFASSAHLSSAFREMFGVSPSSLTRAGLARTAVPADS